VISRLIFVISARGTGCLDDVRDVLLIDADAEHERGGDYRIRASLGHQLEDLVLAR
jgi:hypothetical protein